MPLLVKFSQDWSDEFQGEGFAILTQEEWDTVIANARKSLEWAEQVFLHSGQKASEYRPNWEIEFYFGTNEAFSFSSLEEYLDSFTVSQISEEEAAFLRLHFNIKHSNFSDGISYGSFGICPLADPMWAAN